MDLNWLSNDLMQMIWLSTAGLGFNQVGDFVFCETSFKNQASKLKTKTLCETSFKNEALKITNEAFLRDFLQKSSVEDQKRSMSVRLPSKIKL